MGVLEADAHDENPSAGPPSGIAKQIDLLRSALAQLDQRLAGLQGRRVLRGRSLELVQDVTALLRELAVPDNY